MGDNPRRCVAYPKIKAPPRPAASVRTIPASCIDLMVSRPIARLSRSVVTSHINGQERTVHVRSRAREPESDGGRGEANPHLDGEPAARVHSLRSSDRSGPGGDDAGGSGFLAGALGRPR